MACPFFYPSAPLGGRGWSIAPRLPLGDAYGGHCRAGAEAHQPAEERMRGACNTGYGRGECDRFPPGASFDAVRFHAIEEHAIEDHAIEDHAGQDHAGQVRIQYIFERDCRPWRHGSIADAHEPAAGDDEILRRQAAAFLESYLRRRNA